MNTKTTTIAYVAGKSGGHLVPTLTKAQEAHCNNPHITSILFVTTTDLDKKITKNYPCIDQIIFTPLSRPKKIWGYPRFMYQLFAAFVRAMYHLKKNTVQEIVSMGELVSLPVCIAAYALRIPITLYELNVVPGKTIKLLAPLATTINICFEQTHTYLKKYTPTLVPYPLRFSQSDLIDQRHARQQLELTPDTKTILLLGGSQGSLFLNSLLKNYLEQHSPTMEIIHQTGSNDSFDWKSFYKRKKIQALVFDYHHQIAQCYAAADLIICRSGAGTLFEAIFFEKSIITIPLETTTTNHQVNNAHAFAQKYPEHVTVITHNELTKDTSLLNVMINHLLSCKRLINKSINNFTQ